LGRRLDQQDAREQGFSREMAAQKGFVTAYRVFAPAVFARVEGGQSVDEPEIPAMRQRIQGMLQIFFRAHFLVILLPAAR
jgi:hypothetical protein